MAVNAGMLEDYGRKHNFAFCQTCGRAFIKQDNKQKRGGTPGCQSIRNCNKSKAYNYRHKRVLYL